MTATKPLTNWIVEDARNSGQGIVQAVFATQDDALRFVSRYRVNIPHGKPRVRVFYGIHPNWNLRYPRQT